MSGRILTGVRGHFCAAHRGADGKLHGHTWLVRAWWPDGNRAETLMDRLQNCLARFDHETLPDHLAWGEGIAQDIGLRLTGCVAVEVSREAEGIYARWEA